MLFKKEEKIKKDEIVIVSACLVGLNTRYDGKNEKKEEIYRLFLEGKVIPLCPEQLGGLPTPRQKATIIGNIVINESGEDITASFKRGAEEVLNCARELKVKRIYLKEGSPSCGVHFTNKNWKRHKGLGITARLLKKFGMNLIPID